MTDYYYDNNDTIYATDRELHLNTTAGNSIRLHLGLSDLTELSGQSTVFVNKVVCKYRGYGHKGGVNQTYGSMVCGIVPASVAGSGTPSDTKTLGNYQDIRGWPLKNGKQHYYAYTGSLDTNFLNSVSMSFTYRPKKALLLNRDQRIIMTVTNAYGVNITGLLSMELQLKRGQ